MLRPLVIATIGFALTLPRLAAQTSPQDSTAIRATAHDYIDGWYEGDGARMERALHPHLAKRLVYEDQQGHSRLVDLTALELVQTTRTGVGKIPPAERRDSVTILDVFGNAAVVRIDATTWVDFLQEVKWNGRWAIVNVVWVNRPKAP
jgi:Putative lumazine-binding